MPIRWLLAAVALVGLTVCSALAYAYVSYRHGPLSRGVSAGPNAAWFAHKWVGAEQPDESYAALADRVNRNRLTDAFFHVGPLTASGFIPPDRFPAAERLIRELELRVPDLRAQAWIGQIEKRGGGPLDLADPAVRAAIAETSELLLALGFDGIHVNIEPSTGNPYLLDLLAALRPIARDRDAVLSMATDELEPLPGLAWLTRAAGTKAGFWTADFYDSVLGQVDQVAVMMYDTGLPADWLYGSLVRWQAAAIRNLAGKDTTVFMGVPTYDERRITFHARAENMRSALRGIRQSLAAMPPPAAAQFGIAVYADWTTDDSEWRHYRRAWLGVENENAAIPSRHNFSIPPPR